MMKPLVEFSCMLIDVINDTLAACDYRDCNQVCMNYLMYVSSKCPHVFNNERYLELWNTLFDICAEIGVQTSPFYLDK
jgi:hypothetical protein